MTYRHYQIRGLGVEASASLPLPAGLSPGDISAAGSKAFDPSNVFGAAQQGLSSMGGDPSTIILGFVKDFNKAVDAAQREEYGVLLQAAAPAVADGLCSILGMPPGQCSGAARTIGNIASDVIDVLKSIFAGTDWTKYHLDSSVKWQQASAVVIGLAKLAAMKERAALGLLLNMWKEGVRRKYCSDNFTALVPTAEIEAIFLKHYRANSYPDKGKRELLPTAWGGLARDYTHFAQSNQRFCVPGDPHRVELNARFPGSAPPGYMIPDIWIDKSTILDLKDPYATLQKYGNVQGGHCNPENWNPAAMQPRPFEGERYFLYLSCIYYATCASHSRWANFIPWYTSDLKSRITDVDIALGESMPELPALVDSWAKRMNLRTCAKEAEFQAALSKEREAKRIAEGKAADIRIAAAKEVAVKEAAAKVAASSGSWTPWLIGGAAVLGLSYYFYARKR